MTVVVVLAITAGLAGVVVSHELATETELEARGRSIFSTLVLARSWSAAHGGVFVEKRPGMVSSPYLENPDRTGVDGTVYTLKNPALMTREISELAEKQGAFRLHITSLRPLNPANAPDAFERDALGRFEAGQPEATLREVRDGTPWFRYMAPLRVQADCLRCHEKQGYRVGDVRGGISVAFSMAEEEASVVQVRWAVALIFLVAATALVVLVNVLVAGLRRRLQAAESRFRTLADSAPVGIFEADAKGRSVYLNRAGELITGQTPQAALGVGWLHAIHPGDRERVSREWDETVKAGRPFESEFRFARPRGGSVMVRGYASVLRDVTGRTTGYIGVVVDVTEAHALREQLEVSSRLAALGTMVGGIAHEINNPLAAILFSQRHLSKELAGWLRSTEAGAAQDQGTRARLARELLEVLADSQGAAERIVRIIKDLTLLGRPGMALARVDLRSVVDQAIRRLPSPALARADVEVVEGGVQEVLASEPLLVQAVANLVSNAAWSIPETRRGRITIRMGAGSPGRVVLEVSDDGEGMAPETLKRVFDPFFTTREVGQGAGLGLPVVHSILETLGGSVRARSEVGKGSTFTVELPAAPPEG